jgi:hypothetical protein
MSDPIYWPSSLPDYVLTDGYGEQPVAQKASFQSEVGPPIERARGTMRIIRLDATWLMSAEQVTQFENFVIDTLSQGTADFFWTRPRTGEVKTAHIVSDSLYSVTPVSGLWFHVSTTLMLR